ncbi:peptidase [Streptomyces sp. NPDC047046]|uniref:peptidase n=1 Tax=Streptomyces sp. NPDC047046 TaxID=3155378 RepID=UPI0033C07F0B
MTLPVLLLAGAPAFAEGGSAAQAQKQPGIAELRKAAEAAQAVYDQAVGTEKSAREALDVVLADGNPLAVAATAAVSAAKEAEAAQASADQAVVDAQAALDALPEAATDEERAAAESKLGEAKAAAGNAAEAKAGADDAAARAVEARDDERVAAARKVDQAEKATKAALADKTAAGKALAEALDTPGEGGETGGTACVPEAGLTTDVRGLPSTVVAGTKVGFTLRVTNGTDKTMDKVLPFAYVHATDESGLRSSDELVHLQWSSGSSSTWKTVDNKHYMDAISPLKAGAHTDIKMRLGVDASAPAGKGVTFVAGDYINDDGSCGGSPDLEDYEFVIGAAGSGPIEIGIATPSTTGPHTAAPTPGVSSGVQPQGGTSQPVGGSLAATGSSSGLPQLALASGAALAAGGGALVLVRRRKAGAHA